MDISKNIASNIIKMCADKGITVNRLAYLTNITQSTIDSILKGKSKNPKIETLIAIADYFDVSIDYLVGRTNSKQINK